MKATRTTCLLVACFAGSAAYANPPQAGGNDASIGAIDGNTSSTTSRLKGEVLFGLRDTLGENDPAEGALFGASDRLRLGFDSSFTGEDALRARLSGGVGYTENVGEHVVDSDNSSYLFLGGDIGATIENGPFNAIVGLGGVVTYYDEDLDWREDDENLVGDLQLSLGASYRISDSAVLKGYFRGYYGGHANVSRDFLKGGVTSSNYFFWDLDLGADYRFDGMTLGERGTELSTNFVWSGLLEDGDNSFGDELDNYTINIRQEGRYNFNADNTVFIAGSYGMRDFDDFHPMGNLSYSAESHNFRVGGGVRHGCGGVATLGLEAGVEFRDYDDLPAEGDDDRTEFYINGDLNWEVTEALGLGVYADYGIQNFQINEYPADAFLDPVGLRSGLRAHCQWTHTTSLTADWSFTCAEGSDVVSSFYDDDDFRRWACGLSLNHMLNDRVELFVDGEVVQVDNDFDDDTFLRGAIGARVGF